MMVNYVKWMRVLLMNESMLNFKIATFIYECFTD